MPARARREILDRFWTWGYDERGWSLSTRQKYLRRVKTADEWLTEHRGVSLVWARPKDIKAYLFSTPPNARNRNNVRQALVGFGAFLVDQEVLEENPSADLPRIPEPESLPSPRDPEDVARMLAVAPTFGAMVEAHTGILCYCALRRGEARTLEWSHVRGDWLQFRGKRQKERAVPLGEARSSVLKWRRESDEARWLFPSPKIPGQPISPRHQWQIIRDLEEAAGVDHERPHTLRHTTATVLLEETGGDIRTVQVFLGHADPRTTAGYAKVRDARLVEAARKIRFRP